MEDAPLKDLGGGRMLPGTVPMPSLPLADVVCEYCGDEPALPDVLMLMITETHMMPEGGRWVAPGGTAITVYGPDRVCASCAETGIEEYRNGTILLRLT